MPVQPMHRPHSLSLEQAELEAVQSAAELTAEAILNEARLAAAEILAQAEAQAADLLAQERQNVQAMLLAEVDAAKAQGYQDGLAQGVRQAEADCAGMIEAAEEQYRSALDERRRYLAEAEPMIVDLALGIAKKIITRESSADRSFVVDVVRTALEEMHDGGKVEVRVHPDDHEAVQQSRELLRKAVPGQTELLIIKDHSVEAGGCVVCTAFGNIDARIDTQLEEVRKALQEVAAGLEP